MNKATITLFLTAFCGLCLAAGVQAADMNHAMGTGQTMAGNMAMDQGHPGEKIHESTVEGYHLRYELIDMKAQMAQSGTSHSMPAEMKSHHLMVYVTDAKGDQVDNARAGYLVTGPAGEQKAMAMAMAGGYGADVDLEPAGTYTVKTKVVTPEGKKLLDQFTYQAK